MNGECNFNSVDRAYLIVIYAIALLTMVASVRGCIKTEINNSKLEKIEHALKSKGIKNKE